MLDQVRKFLYGHDGTSAMDVLLSHYDDPYTLYNTWKRIRTKLIRDPKIQNQDYPHHLERCLARARQKQASTNDQETLLSLIKTNSYPAFHNVLSSVERGFPVFEDDELTSMFLEQLPFSDAFYEFTVPDDIHSEAMKARTTREWSKFNENPEHTLSNAELEQIKLEAVALLQGGYISKYKSGTRFIEALLLVSGRRVKEIMATLVLHGQGPTTYSAMVSGLCKQKTSLGAIDNLTTEPVLIPLLVPYDLFKLSLGSMREQEGSDFSTPDKEEAAFKRLARRMSRVVWGNNRNLRHADRRCLYGELAYNYRDQHQCYTGINKRLFISKVLGHVSLKPQATDMYSHYKFT